MDQAAHRAAVARARALLAGADVDHDHRGPEPCPRCGGLPPEPGPVTSWHPGEPVPRNDSNEETSE